MNTLGAVASNAGAYIYIHLYMYIMLYYKYAMYIYYVCVSVKSAFVRTTKSTLELHYALYNIAQNISVFENEWFPTTAVQQRQHMDADRVPLVF
jgi:hypothetical protein